MALGNTPAVARSSYIDPPRDHPVEDDVVIDVPDASSQPAVPMRIDSRRAEQNGSSVQLVVDGGDSSESAEAHVDCRVKAVYVPEPQLLGEPLPSGLMVTGQQMRQPDVADETYV
jgi:hypothetical protein